MCRHGWNEASSWWGLTLSTQSRRATLARAAGSPGVPGSMRPGPLRPFVLTGCKRLQFLAPGDSSQFIM